MVRAAESSRKMRAGAINHALGDAAMRLLEQRLVKLIPVASPTAGNEIIAKVPGGVMWEILHFRALLTTSAVVATRLPKLAYRDPDLVTRVTYPSAVSQAASLVNNFDWDAGIGATVSATGIANPLSTPPIPLPSGWTVITATGLLDVGDQWSAVSLLVREWSEDQVVQELLEISTDLSRQVLPETST